MDRKAGYKECPRCGLRNKPSALQCDFCGLRFIAGEDWDDNIQALEKMGGNEEKVLVDEDVSKRIEATIVKRDKINASPIRPRSRKRMISITSRRSRTGQGRRRSRWYNVRTVDRGGPGNCHRGRRRNPARPSAPEPVRPLRHRKRLSSKSTGRSCRRRSRHRSGKGEEGGQAGGQADARRYSPRSRAP